MSFDQDPNRKQREDALAQQAAMQQASQHQHQLAANQQAVQQQVQQATQQIQNYGAAQGGARPWAF